MEAPDKIYLVESTRIIDEWRHKPSAYARNHEYIRKDALLEWAKNEMKEWSSESNTAQGVKMGLTLVLDKIESL